MVDVKQGPESLPLERHEWSGHTWHSTGEMYKERDMAKYEALLLREDGYNAQIEQVPQRKDGSPRRSWGSEYTDLVGYYIVWQTINKERDKRSQAKGLES